MFASEGIKILTDCKQPFYVRSSEWNISTIFKEEFKDRENRLHEGNMSICPFAHVIKFTNGTNRIYYEYNKTYCILVVCANRVTRNVS